MYPSSFNTHVLEGAEILNQSANKSLLQTDQVICLSAPFSSSSYIYKTLHGFVNHPRGAGCTTQNFIRTSYLQPSNTRETETHLSYASDLCSRLIARSTPTLVAFKQNSEAAKREIKAGLCAEGDNRETTIQIQGQFKVLISPHINPCIQREPRQTQGETCKVHPEKTQEDHRNWILDLVSVRDLQSLTEYWHILPPFIKPRWWEHQSGRPTSAHPPAEHQRWDWVAQN